jgi:hypothetical protein
MKTAPHLAVGLTTFAALAAGYVLATEDRALFEPQQAQLLVWAEESPRQAPVQDVGGALGRVSFRREAFAMPQAASPAARVMTH